MSKINNRPQSFGMAVRTNQETIENISKLTSKKLGKIDNLLSRLSELSDSKNCDVFLTVKNGIMEAGVVSKLYKDVESKSTRAKINGLSFQKFFKRTLKSINEVSKREQRINNITRKFLK